MAEPFVGEIRMFGFDFPPVRWARCDGAIVPITQSQTLYSLLGVIYGGDGRNNFKLPDLRGRTPVHSSGTYDQGTSYGFESTPLNEVNMPAHTHMLNVQPLAGDKPNVGTGSNRLLAKTSNDAHIYGNSANLQQLNASSISSAGSGNYHYNSQPSLACNFCIALEGLYPSRN